MPSIVDFPHPEGPRMATNEPRSAVRLKSASTGMDVVLPTRNDFETRSRTAAASGMGHQRHLVDRRFVVQELAGRAVAPAIDAPLDRADDDVLDQQNER